MDESWPKEDIPDGDNLFMRIHRNYVRDNEPIPGVFTDHGSGMSTNWQKYCPKAEDARQKAGNPDNNGVIVLVAGDVRSISPLKVEHTPDFERKDRSHADVIGKKDAEVRLKLLDIYRWAIEV